MQGQPKNAQHRARLKSPQVLAYRRHLTVYQQTSGSGEQHWTIRARPHLLEPVAKQIRVRIMKIAVILRWSLSSRTWRGMGRCTPTGIGLRLFVPFCKVFDSSDTVVVVVNASGGVAANYPNGQPRGRGRTATAPKAIRKNWRPFVPTSTPADCSTSLAFWIEIDAAQQIVVITRRLGGRSSTRSPSSAGVCFPTVSC